MIRGRAYHPQTQGSIEIANRVFKNRLRAHQASTGRSDWAALMTEIAFRLNTTTSRALPRGKTPFDIWFGRQRRWIQQEQLSDNETEVEDMEEGEGEDDTAELEDIEGAEDVEEPLENTELGELAEVEEEEVADRQDIHSEISDLCFYAEDEDAAEEENNDEQAENNSAEVSAATSVIGSAHSAESVTDLMPHEAVVAENNLRLHEQMRRKGAAKAKGFADNEVATLFIPKKQWLVTEQSRLTVRILNERSMAATDS
jgi:hypothetical protein